MISSPLAAMTDRSPSARGRRRRGIVIPVVAALLAIGAFLLWGPIGLGNGPLSVEVHGAEGWPDFSQTPVGFTIPIFNSGRGLAVIDAVDTVGGTSYAAPRELGFAVLSSDNCPGAQSARADGRAFVMAGCGGRDRGPLIGYGIAAGRFIPAAAAMTAPRSGTCWVMTKIVVRYHVGIRHYAASYPYALAACGRGTSSAQVLAAMHASYASPG
jgi:hypothetical protein